MGQGLVPGQQYYSDFTQLEPRAELRPSRCFSSHLLGCKQGESSPKA